MSSTSFLRLKGELHAVRSESVRANFVLHCSSILDDAETSGVWGTGYVGAIQKRISGEHLRRRCRLTMPVHVYRRGVGLFILAARNAAATAVSGDAANVCQNCSEYLGKINISLIPQIPQCAGRGEGNLCLMWPGVMKGFSCQKTSWPRGLGC